MPWHSPPTWSPGYVVTDTDTDNYLRDNPNYLLGGRPDTSGAITGFADYGVGVTTFADVDATNLILSPTLSGSKYLCVCLMTVAAAASHYLYLDWIVDSTTRAGGVNGLVGAYNGICSLAVIALFQSLSAAAHTFKIQARIDTAGFTGTIYRNSLPITPWGMEVG